MNGGAFWWRDNERRYASRETCQRACDFLNRRGGPLWREPVISADGTHFEMWAAVYADLYVCQDGTDG